MSFGAWVAFAALAPTAWAASLDISTYLKDGFTPTAIASDAAGNVYLAGSAMIDPASLTMGALVAKLDPKASQYLYLTYFDSAANDQISAMAIDGMGKRLRGGMDEQPLIPARSERRPRMLTTRERLSPSSARPARWSFQL